MDIEILKKFFNELRNSVLIVSDDRVISWMNNWANNILKNDNIKVGTKFDDCFFVDKIEKNKNFIYTENNSKYFYKSYKFKDKTYSIILLYSIQNFDEDYNKICCYEKVLNTINDGIILTDYLGHIRVLNPMQAKMENEKAEKFIGKYLWDVYYYDLESETCSEHREVFHSREPIIEKYRLFKYKEGHPRYLYYSTYPIINREEVIGVFSVSKNEEKLQQLLSETIELKRKIANRVLLEKNNSKELINGTTFTFGDIIGQSEVIEKIIKEAQLLATLQGNVLIVGETGTGKEMFAQSMHNYVNRSEPFIAINCAAIPENLLESILFGSVKGAYTGAVDSTGLFIDAGKGTLFLDELNSMPVSMQTKLLRVLQERKVRKIGDTKTYPIYCRIISAINEDPKELIKSGQFRSDLFYRISGLTLNIPPLRDRSEDILYLTNQFIKKHNEIFNKNVSIISLDLENMLLKYKWPGNIRELEYVVENLMIRVKNNTNILIGDDMPEHLKNDFLLSDKNKKPNFEKKLLNDAINDYERKIILEALEDNNWNITRTSKQLGIIRQSLLYKMKRLNITKEER